MKPRGVSLFAWYSMAIGRDRNGDFAMALDFDECIKSAVGGDAIEPGRKGCLLLERVEAPVCFDKNILRDIFCIFSVTHHAVHQPIHRVHMALHEHLIAERVTWQLALAALNKLFISQGCKHFGSVVVLFHAGPDFSICGPGRCIPSHSSKLFSFIETPFWRPAPFDGAGGK